MKKIFLEDCCDILDSMRVPITAKDRKSGIYPYYGANGLQDYVSDYIFDDELVLLAEDGGHFNSKEHPIAYRVSGKCWVNNHAHVLRPKSGIDVDYLCYTLMFYDVSKMINGTTRKKLNQSSMRKMLIPIVNYNEQLAIVYRLKIIENLIDNRQQQLNLLDELIESRFIEMFGDPVTNPMGWEYIFLSEALKTKPQNGLYKPQSDYVKDNSGVPILRIDAFYDGKVKDFSKLKRLHCTEEERKDFLLKENDIVINRVNSLEYLGKCAHITGLLENTVFESNMMRFHLLDEYNPVYVIKLLCSQYIKNQIMSCAKKAVNQASINQQDVQKFIILKPPIELQNKFADFVEQVEKTKVTIKKSLDELHLLKDSLMQKYFD